MDSEYLSLIKLKFTEENGLPINSMDKAKSGILLPSIKRKAKFRPLLSPSGSAIVETLEETDSKEKVLYISREGRSFWVGSSVELLAGRALFISTFLLM